MPEFDWKAESNIELPQWTAFRFKSLREMVLSEQSSDVLLRPVLIGVLEGQIAVITLADLQHAYRLAAVWCAERQIFAGDRVTLLRLPYVSELIVAINALALMSCGVSVVLPMQASTDVLSHILRQTACRFVLFPETTQDSQPHPETQQALQQMAGCAVNWGIADCPLPIPWPFDRNPAAAEQSGYLERDIDAEILILTTSATTGPPKLVSYSERALLTVAESWQVAGLLDEHVTGGASLCPLFSHSMGIRNVLHAIWTRNPTLLIPPEWLNEAPHAIVGLLQAWPPQHFTAGPALIHALAGLGRTIPEARRALKSLRVIVSSGSEWDDAAANLFGTVRTANAFGMTETQQILSTLISRSSAKHSLGETTGSRKSLGRPLPGVSVAVRFTDPDANVGELFVKSPFSAMGYVGEPPFPEWLGTGDIVRVCDEEIEYLGRVADDFINLGSGLKLSSPDIEQRYAFLAKQFQGLILRHSPGRSGVIAIAYCGAADPEDPELHNHLQQCIAAFHDRLQSGSADVGLRHSLLVAIGLISGELPRTNTGKFRFARIAEQHGDLLDALNSPTGRHAALIEMEPLNFGREAAFEHSLPYAGQLLQALKLDVEFTAGKGDYLFRDVQGKQCPVLDLVGGFGVNLLGHGHSEVETAAIEAMRRVPMLDQVSYRAPAAMLARTLSNRLGEVTGRRYVCLFHSTGTEAVESALKHAILKWGETFREWNDQMLARCSSEHPDLASKCHAENLRSFADFRPLLIAVQGAYHGKTSGALHAMGDEEQRKPFAGLIGARVCFVSRAELKCPEMIVGRISDAERMWLDYPIRENGEASVGRHPFPGIFAALAEPIQGEGGVFEVPQEFFEAVRKTQIPLIVDEIQCGLGRSGQFPASTGVVANYYLLGKALGGGVGKIAVTLIDRADYVEDFDMHSGATFSGDAVSCQIALKVLSIIDRDGIPNQSARLGLLLREKLQAVQQEFPRILLRITGRGAMQGIELGLQTLTQQFLREILADRLGYFAASWLLHNHSVRILPTLSAPSILRIEPSAFLSDNGIAQFIAALRDFCQHLSNSNSFGLLRHLFAPDSVSHSSRSKEKQGGASDGGRSVQRLKFRFPSEPPAPGSRRVGFILNPIYPTDELLAELPELMDLSIDQRIELTERLQVLLQLRPLELFSKNLFGNRVWLCGIMLPAAAGHLEKCKQSGKLKLVRQRLNQALRIAAERGCQTVVFGAQTSIVTANATALQRQPGVQISSGNSFTVAVMLAQLEATRLKTGLPKTGRLAIVGATGNIGSAIARWFAAPGNWEGPVCLLGRVGQSPRLAALQKELSSNSGNSQVLLMQNSAELELCDVIVVAVSGDQTVIESQHVNRKRRVLVADVSQPRAVSASISTERPLATVIQAGLVKLPEDPDFRLTPHTPRGTCFACTAEALLMGLEPHPLLRLNGNIDPDAVATLLRMGRKYGMIEPGMDG